LLSWEALAHWISCDGTYNSGVRIQTECFTVKEVVFIMNVLIVKFNLECSLHEQRGHPILYIKSKSIKRNLHSLLPYLTTSWFGYLSYSKLIGLPLMQRSKTHWGQARVFLISKAGSSSN
jgi:hypothetical protein